VKTQSPLFQLEEEKGLGINIQKKCSLKEDQFERNPSTKDKKAGRNLKLFRHEEDERRCEDGKSKRKTCLSRKGEEEMYIANKNPTILKKGARSL